MQSGVDGGSGVVRFADGGVEEGLGGPAHDFGGFLGVETAQVAGGEEGFQAVDEHQGLARTDEVRRRVGWLCMRPSETSGQSRR